MLQPNQAPAELQIPTEEELAAADILRARAKELDPYRQSAADKALERELEFNAYPG